MGLPLTFYPMMEERVRATVARGSESASGGPTLLSGDLPRPQIRSTECSGSTLVDTIGEGQWSVSYTQPSFVMGDVSVVFGDTQLKGSPIVV